MAQFFDVHPDNPQPRLLKQAVAIIAAGGIAAIPTDSSYALVCHLDDKAAADTLRIMQEEKAGEAGGVMHCFGGTAEMAEKLMQVGFYISFAGNVTFKKAENLREAARVVRIVPEIERHRRQGRQAYGAAFRSAHACRRRALRRRTQPRSLAD